MILISQRTCVLCASAVVFACTHLVFTQFLYDRSRYLFAVFKALLICGAPAFLCSNFNLVIRCSDGSLWALGLGEYDRSTCAFPLRVQQAADAASESIADSHKGEGTASEERDGGESSADVASVESGSGSGPVDVSSAQTGDSARNQRRRQEGKSQKKKSGGGVGVPEIPLDPPATLPSSAVLRKGFNRVTILSDDLKGLAVGGSAANGVPPTDEKASTSTNTNTNTMNAVVSVYEVIVHAGEAYLKKKTIEVEAGNGSSRGSAPKVIDFSTGWQHTLAIIL
jgi:hypothetical protein